MSARHAIALLVGLQPAACMVLTATSIHAQQATAHMPTSQQVHRIERDRISLELAPLSHEQVSAFLIGRGISTEDADVAAQRGCIFRSAIGNAATTSDGPQVRISLAEWKTLPEKGAPARLGLREDWDEYWRQRNMAEAPSVAFHWALFPSEQVFAPTDHNWGFLAFMLAPGKHFDLDVVWHVGEKAHRARIEGLRCPS